MILYKLSIEKRNQQNQRESKEVYYMIPNYGGMCWVYYERPEGLEHIDEPKFQRNWNLRSGGKVFFETCLGKDADEILARIASADRHSTADISARL